MILTFFKDLIKPNCYFLTAPKSGNNNPLNDSQSTRVVIVPVNHMPDQTAKNVMWNPYDAEDEITKLNESQLVSIISRRKSLQFWEQNNI